MPFFARRRLQKMRNDLSQLIVIDKAKDLLHRLENKRVEQALPAEMELALLWGLSKLGRLEVEPDWWKGSRRPDVFITGAINAPLAIEIAAANDNSISAESSMDSIALLIQSEANKHRKGIGDYLSFQFDEESEYENSSYYRHVKAPLNYSLSDSARKLISAWVKSDSKNTHIKICERGLDVAVTLTEYRQVRYHNCFTSMPPEAHSETDNPLYELLKRKAKQLEGAPPGTIRSILVADVGSALLNRMGRGDYYSSNHSVTGTAIIRRFMANYGSQIECVIIMTARRDREILKADKLSWAFTVLSERQTEVPLLLGKLKQILPVPKREGYQARSLFRQGAFDPKARGHYLGMHMETSKNQCSAKISSRMVLDLLAGRLTYEHYRAFFSNNGNAPFKHWLDLGMTFKDVKFESGGYDEDDDLLVFSFDADPSARKLK